MNSVNKDLVAQLGELEEILQCRHRWFLQGFRETGCFLGAAKLPALTPATPGCEFERTTTGVVSEAIRKVASLAVDELVSLRRRTNAKRRRKNLYGTASGSDRGGR